MERVVNLQFERLPEGVYLATSDDVPGLVAQGRTVTETLAQRLKAFGFAFDRQAAGSHEIWFDASTGRYTTLANHPGDLAEGTLRAICGKQASKLTHSWNLESWTFRLASRIASAPAQPNDAPMRPPSVIEKL